MPGRFGRVLPTSPAAKRRENVISFQLTRPPVGNPNEKRAPRHGGPLFLVRKNLLFFGFPPCAAFGQTLVFRFAAFVPGVFRRGGGFFVKIPVPFKFAPAHS